MKHEHPGTRSNMAINLQEATGITEYLQLLHSIHPASANKELRKPDFSCVEQARIQDWHSTAAWLLDIGKEFTHAVHAVEYTSRVNVSTPRQCYKNSTILAELYPDLTYTEGYAFTGTIPLCITHAWCTTEDGAVVDPTWSDLDLSKASYYGIPMQLSFVRAVSLDTGLYGVLDSIWMSKVARNTPMREVLPLHKGCITTV